MHTRTAYTSCTTYPPCSHAHTHCVHLHKHTRTCRTHTQARTHLHKGVSLSRVCGGGWASSFQKPAMHTLAVYTSTRAHAHAAHIYKRAHMYTGVCPFILFFGWGCASAFHTRHGRNAHTRARRAQIQVHTPTMHELSVSCFRCGDADGAPASVY
jgi:hypothetical protein